MKFLVLLMLTGISPHVCDVLKEQPFVPSATWSSQNVILPRGSEIKGAFRLDLFPHIVEPFECYDDPEIEKITLQLAARLGKTAWAIALICKEAATKPCPAAFGDADEKSVKRVLGRTWLTMEKIAALKDQLPPRHLRAQDKIVLATMIVHGAWSGSPASAADYGARLVIKNEASKMSKRKSDEAPFAELLDERAKGFWNRKILQMSTPTRKGVCYIERERLAGDNRRRMVPCPHCNYFQELVEGEAIYDRHGKLLGLKNGGLRWDHLKNGHSSPKLAKETAWYECCACKKKILEEHRYRMLNSGVWVPEGCNVTSAGKIVGTPTRPGNHASFGPLSTLHSLIPGVSIGMVAQKAVESRERSNEVGDPRAKRRNFVNSWMGLTWDDAPKGAEPNELAARLCIPGNNLLICPEWSRFLTRASDVQSPDNQFEFWWEVWAWGARGRGALIDKGVSDRAGLKIEINNRFYEHADNGSKLRPMITLIDSGDHATDIYAFCREFRGVWPCKGSSTSKFPTMYRISGLEKSPTSGDRELQAKLGGLVLFEINHEKTNWWVENSITGLVGPEDDNGVNFPAELAMDDEFFRQWASEYPLNSRTDDGYEIHEWKKRYANEWRDVGRYNFVAAWYQTNHGKNFNRLPPRLTSEEAVQKQLAAQMMAQQRAQEGLKTPDGRPFFVGNR